MPDITLTFSSDINISAQVGDTAYWCKTSSSGGFTIEDQQHSSSVYEIGPIKSITKGSTTSTIVCNPSVVTGGTNPLAGSFILFSKDNKVNMASPLGYYAQVKFTNNSSVKSEMFAAACDVFESSK
jgi:hypothetical protein